MTSRQARKLRREQERKAKKAAYKAGLQAAATPPLASAPALPAVVPPPCDDGEFSPEFIAYANAMRERTGRLVPVVRDGRSLERTGRLVPVVRDGRSLERTGRLVPVVRDGGSLERTGRLVPVVRDGRSERIADRAGIHPKTRPPRLSGEATRVGFVSQNGLQSPSKPRFVSQHAPMPEEFRPAEPEPKRSRAEINRVNAQHSTGPRTPTGKLASSRNSLKHGLASCTLIIPGEDPAAFESLLESLLAEHQPANTIEEMLIDEMAQSWWLTQRALRLQNECFTAGGIDEKRLALFLRYHTTHERAFHKALNTLIRLKRTRAREQAVYASRGTSDQSGFVSQDDLPSQTETRFVSQNDTSEPLHPLCESQRAHPPCSAEAA